MKLRVKIDETFYEVEVENINTRPVIARVDGEIFEVYPEEAASPESEAADSESTTTQFPTLPSPGPCYRTESGPCFYRWKQLC